MINIRRSWGQLALLVLALGGIGISIYLTSVHYDNAPLVCSTSGVVDCARVLASPYSVVPGTTIPISVPGLLWCIVMGVLAFAAWRIFPGRGSLLIAELVWALSGIVTVLYLVFIELVRLRTICAWCTGLHVIILAMLLITVVQVQQQPSSELEDVDEEEEKPSLVQRRG
ncbi:MAG: hypothetical protein NVS4B11_10140 [Ktedonobacteraceae bacterium]